MRGSLTRCSPADTHQNPSAVRPPIPLVRMEFVLRTGIGLVTRERLMSDEYCDPLAVCTGLDGRLLIEQTLQGPSLAIGGDIGIAGLTGSVALRPYIRFRYMQSWVPKELCKAPVR